MDKLLVLKQSDTTTDYQTWLEKCVKWSYWNYYACAAFLIVHPLVMCFIYDCWANYNYTLLGISLVQMMLGAYCWAIADEKYEYWIKQHLWFFYIFGSMSALSYVIGMCAGGYMYM